MNISERPSLDDLALLTEASDLLTLQALEGVLQRILDLAAKAVDAERATLLLYDEDETAWSSYVSGQPESPSLSPEVLQTILDKGLGGWVVRHREGVLVTDTDADARWYHFPDDAYRAGSALSVPMIHHDQLIGVLTLSHTERAHFDTYHLRLMTILANQAAIAVRNARIYNRAQAQRRQLEAVLRAVPDAMLVMDERGKILVASDTAFELLTGQTHETIQRQTVADLAAQDSAFVPLNLLIAREAETPSAENDAAAAPSWSFEVRSERLERDYQVNMSRWQQRDSAAVYGMNGGYIVIMRDITMLRRLGRFKDEMLRLVSHDLRTPLVLIIGYADLLNLDTPEEFPHLRQYVSGIASAAQRMDTMLTDMLRVEKIKSSPLELHETLDLMDILALVIQDIRPLADQKRITLRLNMPDVPLPNITGDRILIRQAMDNLANNAVKYTPDGGEVTIDVSVNEAQRRFNYIVRDNGVGIPKQDLPYLFESFFRANMASNKPIKGAGLGLSLVKNAIQQHGGQVWVESELGVGSTFGFWLPLGISTAARHSTQ
jgi:signal transduction histidine kinase